MDPITMSIIAAGVSAAAKGIGEGISGSKAKKAAKRKIKEEKRETYGNLLENALQRSSDLETHRLSSRARSGKRAVRSMGDTSDVVRGALNI